MITTMIWQTIVRTFQRLTQMLVFNNTSTVKRQYEIDYMSIVKALGIVYEKQRAINTKKTSGKMTEADKKVYESLEKEAEVLQGKLNVTWNAISEEITKEENRLSSDFDENKIVRIRDFRKLETVGAKLEALERRADSIKSSSTENAKELVAIKREIAAKDSEYDELSKRIADTKKIMDKIDTERKELSNYVIKHNLPSP
jgi:chromosome segregation ATPase